VALPRTAVPPRLRQARVGVFSAFFLAGFVAAVWVVNIPAVQERTNISTALLGVDLLVFGLGSVVAMQIGGYVIDKVGSRFTVLTGAIVLVLALTLPGLATNALNLGAALFLLGLGNGALDLAMNDQAVLVERAYQRPIMSAFHAFYSVGGAIGALFGAATQALGLGLEVTFLIGSGIGAVLVVIAVPNLLPRTASGPSLPAPDSGDQHPASTSRSLVRRVALLAGLAFVLMLAEGVANDWSALQAVQRLNQSHALASLSYGVFAIFMTTGRFLADRFSHAFGSVRVVRYGSALAAIGMLTVILSNVYPLTLVGWAVFGFGISGVAPQIFSAAGNLSTSGQGVVLSRVVSAGYTGQLVGPAIIGWIASATGLSLAFILPLVLLAVGVAGAGAVASGSGRAENLRNG
jgi:MFS family permease